jgi:hypothetical protein
MGKALGENSCPIQKWESPRGKFLSNPKMGKTLGAKILVQSKNGKTLGANSCPIQKWENPRGKLLSHTKMGKF